MRLRDNMWLWGHPEGAFNKGTVEDYYHFEDISRLTPMEGCLYLGVLNTFMTPMRFTVNRRQYNKSFTTLREVGWECFDAGTNPELIEPIIADSKEFTNIRRVVFDDFKRDGRHHEIQVETLEKIHDRLHEDKAHPLDMWMVLYTFEFGLDQKEDEDFMRYIAPFDGIIMWTWKECDVPLIPEKFEVFKKMTPNNRRLFGCYLYNFGERKQATAEAVKWQLDWYLERIKAGEAEGIVLHTNTMADVDYEAYDAALAWMAEHGDDEIPFNY